MWCSAFFHLSYCHCRIHLKPISFGVYTLASHSRNVDHKKAVLHSTPNPLFLYVSPMVENFFCHFTFQIGKAQNEYGVSKKNIPSYCCCDGNFCNLKKSERKRNGSLCVHVWKCEYEIGFVLLLLLQLKRKYEKSWSFFSIQQNVDAEIHQGLNILQEMQGMLTFTFP